MIKIDRFEGDYEFLSNFYYCILNYEGITFEHSEAAYQASKTLDMDIRKSFTFLTPGKAKREGKKIKSRENWDIIKLRIMEDIVRAKFNQNPEIKRRLIETNDAILIEGNDWDDHFWGVCDGNGENHLGKILMKIRSDYNGL
jgi:ribA/ribD-fused uncharacterized protein